MDALVANNQEWPPPIQGGGVDGKDEAEEEAERVVREADEAEVYLNGGRSTELDGMGESPGAPQLRRLGQGNRVLGQGIRRSADRSPAMDEAAMCADTTAPNGHNVRSPFEGAHVLDARRQAEELQARDQLEADLERVKWQLSLQAEEASEAQAAAFSEQRAAEARQAQLLAELAESRHRAAAAEAEALEARNAQAAAERSVQDSKSKQRQAASLLAEAKQSIELQAVAEEALRQAQVQAMGAEIALLAERLAGKEEELLTRQTAVTALHDAGEAATERAQAAEERAQAAEERAQAAEERAEESEERANELAASLQSKTDEQEATVAELAGWKERALDAKEREAEEGQRAEAAVQRADAAEQQVAALTEQLAQARATAAVEAHAADLNWQRTAAAEARAADAEQRMAAEEERAAAAERKAAAEEARAAAAERTAAESERQGKRRVQRRKDELRGARLRAEDAQEEVEAYREELAYVRQVQEGTAEELEDELSGVRANLERVTTLSEARGRTIESLRAQLQETAACQEITRLQAQVTAQLGEANEAKAACAHARGLCLAAQEREARAREKAAGLETRLQAAEGGRQTAEGQAAELQDQLNGLTAQLQAATEERKAAVVQQERLQAQCDGLQARALTSEMAAVNAEAIVTAKAVEADGHKARAAALQDKVDQLSSLLEAEQGRGRRRDYKQARRLLEKALRAKEQLVTWLHQAEKDGEMEAMRGDHFEGLCQELEAQVERYQRRRDEAEEESELRTMLADLLEDKRQELEALEEWERRKRRWAEEEAVEQQHRRLQVEAEARQSRSDRGFLEMEVAKGQEEKRATEAQAAAAESSALNTILEMDAKTVALEALAHQCLSQELLAAEEDGEATMHTSWTPNGSLNHAAAVLGLLRAVLNQVGAGTPISEVRQAVYRCLPYAPALTNMAAELWGNGSPNPEEHLRRILDAHAKGCAEQVARYWPPERA
ncbi:hypothetical protein HYH03_009982 [Edaphochlamys debaryana]|uniref:Uncharacterized protein n=1 Tax=Edaphochlamys debaryana TaxID=47281 RepID=A0A835XWR6_9CHLO|nr:hypothetical protein HYH03_009982 [Edaphochlamys debaryana]|eukprot:KAG2491611.1 hypothetical protein HYH03_009982 [Edaphochlamys debaryana]